MFARSYSLILACLVTLTACAQSKKDPWSNIDYSGVYRSAGERDVDTNYRSPSVVGCVNDDLYMCR